MSDEVLVNEEETQAAIEALYKEYQEGQFIHKRVECPNIETSRLALDRFKKKLEVKANPNDVIVEVSPDKLMQIKNDLKYEELRKTGVKNVYCLALAASIVDYPEKFAESKEKIMNILKRGGEYTNVSDVVGGLAEAIEAKGMRAVLLFGDFMDTIEKAEALDLWPGYLPLDVSRSLWNRMDPDDNSFSAIGFTRPGSETFAKLGKEYQTSNNFYNDIAYLRTETIPNLLS